MTKAKKSTKNKVETKAKNKAEDLDGKAKAKTKSKSEDKEKGKKSTKGETASKKGKLKPEAKQKTKSKTAKKSEKAKSKKPVIKEKLTATQTIALIAERADVDNKTVKNVLDATQQVVVESLCKGGVGTAKVLGWNFKSVLKPAVKGGEKKANPFKKGEFIITKPKPASMKLKALPLKAIKDAVSL